MYLIWFDDTPKKAAEKKIAEGCKAYAERYGVEPTIVLCNIDEVCPVPGVAVSSSPYVRRHNYHVGLIGPATD